MCVYTVKQSLKKSFLGKVDWPLQEKHLDAVSLQVFMKTNSVPEDLRQVE